MLIAGDDRGAVLARLDALHSGLTQIVLEGGNLDGIAAEVTRVLDVGVLVTSTDGRERAASFTPDLRTLLDTFDLVDPTGRLRVERIGGDRGISVGEGEIRCLRVAAGGADLARLVCVRPDAPLSSDDVHALERAAAVAALLISREEAVTAVENKYQGDFLRDLFLRRAGDEDYVAEHADVRLGPAPAGRRRGRGDRPAVPGRGAGLPRDPPPVAGPLLGRLAPGQPRPGRGYPQRRLLLRGRDAAAPRSR